MNEKAYEKAESSGERRLYSRQNNHEEDKNDSTTKPVSIGQISSRLKTFAGIDSTCVSDKTETHVESIPANVFRRALIWPI